MNVERNDSLRVRCIETVLRLNLSRLEDNLPEATASASCCVPGGGRVKARPAIT